MKVVFALFLFISACTQAQTDTTKSATEDTLAPYQKTSHMPPFSILLPDSSWFSQVQLKSKKPTLILYFSPTCGHCQFETEDLISNINNLKSLQVVMITSRRYDDMKLFAEHYHLSRFSNIIIGSDFNYLVTRFYAVDHTPFSAFYDKKGNLSKVYKNGIDFKELIRLSN